MTTFEISYGPESHDILRSGMTHCIPSYAIVHRVCSTFRRSSSTYSVAAKASSRSVVFLGSPAVAANVLETLLDVADGKGSPFEISAVVSQPSKPVGRKNRQIPSPTPVSALALEHGYIPDETLLTPRSAKDSAFLEQMEKLKPDLCITAAYGNLLPKRFLQIPSFGTLNIHPSLLPKYRGAAPVNRALQDGMKQTGVSIALTVFEMDAGPVLTSKTVDVDQDIQAPELLENLFSIGTGLLIDALPFVFDGSAIYTPQDPSEATFAPKMEASESIMHFQRTAEELHNQVRAFTPWPGTRAIFKVFNTLNLKHKDFELRIIETQIPKDVSPDFHQGVCFHDNERLFLECGKSSILEVMQVQKPGGRVLKIKDFKNGLAQRDVLTLG